MLTDKFYNGQSANTIYYLDDIKMSQLENVHLERVTTVCLTCHQPSQATETPLLFWGVGAERGATLCADGG